MPERKTNKKINIAGDMPHSLEAEQALLGCLLLDAEVQNEIISGLSVEDFYSDAHKNVFDAMNTLLKRNQPIDLVTLIDLLEKEGTLEASGGITYVAGLTDVMPSSANYRKYFDIVKRESLLRRLIKGSANVIEECKQSTDGDTSLAYAEKMVFDISQNVETSSMTKISAVIPAVMTRLDELSKGKTSLRGIRTGYRELDNIIDGVHNGDLMILAARPGFGKSSLAMNMVENIALQGYSCAVFSLEMSEEQLATRMMCSVAGVDMGKMKKGELNKTDWVKIAKARELLSNAKIYFNESSIIKPSEILSQCRRLKRKSGLDFVVIDYLQLMTPDFKSDSRQQDTADISRSLKILAKEVGVPVLALSQLSREVEKRKGRPQLSDLRESGAIEQDADIVMFIHRPDKVQDEKGLDESKVRQNVAEILVEKHRSGPQGHAKLYFIGECTKFVNINESTGEPEGVEPKVPVRETAKEEAEVKNVDEEIF